MARTITITSPAKSTDGILQDLKTVQGLLDLQLFRGVSVQPPGDVIKATLPNSRLSQVMRLLDRHDLGREGGISATTSSPNSVVPTQPAGEIERDNNEASWEEMAQTISNDSNATANTLLTMSISGALAAIGIATNALHIVVGAMLIAPGFMPITRVALGIVAKHHTWRYGVRDFLMSYLALIVGAALAALLLKALGYPPLPGSPSYYVPAKTLSAYWTSVSVPSTLTSLVAGAAGGLLVASMRSVLTSGVMIGLALVPSAALIGIGLVAADFDIARQALVRFGVEVALVFSLSLAVLACNRFWLHKRDMRL